MAAASWLVHRSPIRRPSPARARFPEVAFSAEETQAGLFSRGVAVTEFPSNWTPEQCAKYRDLMKSKRKAKKLKVEAPID